MKVNIPILQGRGAGLGRDGPWRKHAVAPAALKEKIVATMATVDTSTASPPRYAMTLHPLHAIVSTSLCRDPSTIVGAFARWRGGSLER